MRLVDERAERAHAIVARFALETNHFQGESSPAVVAGPRDGVHLAKSAARDERDDLVLWSVSS